jgi:hypothetical protein
VEIQNGAHGFPDPWDKAKIGIRIPELKIEMDLLHMYLLIIIIRNGYGLL